jgi:fatty acid hydroxylase domain-containing protein 2
MLHHRVFYKRFHKIHHEWTSPTGLMTINAHPLELIISDMIPIAIGPLILRAHPITTSIWFMHATFVSVNGHSGYHLPFIQAPEFHDYHHLNCNQNFGIFGFVDALVGTDTIWRQTKSYKRYTSLYSLESARDIIPD